MFIEFFVNSCVLITTITILCIFFKDRLLVIKSSINIQQKFFIGTVGGLLELLLLFFPVYVIPGLSVNFHILPIILSSIYGGTLSAIVTVLIVNISAYLIFRTPIIAAAYALTDLFLMIGITLILNIKSKRKARWIYSTVYSLLITSIGNIFFFKNSNLLIQFLIIYWINNLILIYFIYQFTEYLIKTFKTYEHLKAEATMDFLTNLNNIRQFNKIINYISTSAHEKTEFEYISLIFLDIDYFKKINDIYGHGSGDIVLRSLANILNYTCGDFAIISRNGGEEFSALLLNYPAIDAIQVAEKIRQNVESHSFHISDKTTIHITISAGVSTYPNTTDNINNLLNDADTALYEAKNTGRNKVILYKKY
ncbi:GGDEF domain-containing protein [Clostridium sp.]|uniref:GGDEF domain-containing protein n=1 Tax=Clostridium sp. TaxID=1506 RepID=UPI00359FB90D